MDFEYERYGVQTSSYVPGSRRTLYAGRHRVDEAKGTWGLKDISIQNIVKQSHRSTFVIQNGPSRYSYKIPRKGGITQKEAARVPRSGNLLRVVGSEQSEVPDGYMPGDGAARINTYQDNATNDITNMVRQSYDQNSDGRAVDRRVTLAVAAPDMSMPQPTRPFNMMNPLPAEPPIPPPAPPVPLARDVSFARPELRVVKPVPPIVQPNIADMFAQINRGKTLKPTVVAKREPAKNVLAESMATQLGKIRAAVEASPVSPNDQDWR